MRVLITGINGFVGQHLLKKLSYLGHDVYGIDIKCGFGQCFEVDITDKEKLKDVLLKIKPDFIYHLAAISKVIDNPLSIYKINVEGTFNLFYSALSLNPKPNIVFISSAQVYGNSFDYPVDETYPVNPVNYYGASKAAGEMIARSFIYEESLPVCILRPFNHTGVGQSKDFVIPKLVDAFKKKMDFIELGNIDVVRDFLDVRDVVEIYTLFIENFFTGEVFNICSNTGYSLSDIISIMERISNYKIKVFSKKDYIRENDIRYLVGSNKKLLSKTGYKIKYGLEDTIKNMLEG